MFPKRPTRNETEEDILRQQEEYLRQKGADKATLPTPQVNDNNNVEEPTTEPQNTIEFGNLNLQIVERDLSHNPEYAMLYVNRNVNSLAQNEQGFPTAPSLSAERTNNNSTSTRGPSLYAQKYLKKSVPTQNSNDTAIEDTGGGIVTGAGLGNEHWKRDIAEIKHENDRLINNMSVEEIEAMRAELLKKLNPKTVAFLQSKQFKYRSEVVSKQEEAIEKVVEEMQIETPESMEIDVTEKLAVPIEEIQAKKYVHMDVIEKEKLSWLGEIPSSDNSNKKEEAVDFSARFNFEGDLIAPDKGTEIDVHEGLHHHGDEPDRPGYTVNELFMYLQSSFPSQKQIGLKVFEKIISKAYLGLYDACFNANLIEYLLKDTPLVLVVRTCLDDAGETVWKSAISTLKAILCNTVYDEIFLDRGYLVFEDYLNHGYRIDLRLQPVLDSEVEITDQVPDQQFAMYDLVACLLSRTSILQRFAYLIKCYLHSDDVVFIEEILDILIRMARHSKTAAESILECADLMDALCSQLINRSVLMSQCRLMHCKAFKLVRVCISSIQPTTSSTSTLPASLSHLFDRFNDISFVDSLNLSLSLNPEDVSQEAARTLLKISIESLKTWLKMLSLVLSECRHSFLSTLKNNFNHMFPSFVKILNFCKTLKPSECADTRSTFDFQFASCVFTLVKMYHEIFGQANELSAVYSFDLFDIAMRWLTVLNSDSIVPDFDTSMCLLVLTEFILKHRQFDDSFINVAYVKLFNGNDRFGEKLFELCRRNSNTVILKHETQGTVRDSANHPSFGSIYFKGSRSVPLLNADSPIFLLNALVRIASTVPSANYAPTSDRVMARLGGYINLVTSNLGKDFVSNIFDLIEINIVSQSCLFIAKQPTVEQHTCKSVLRFALRLNVLNSSATKQQVIDQVLFSPRLYTALSPTYSAEQFAAIRQVYRGFSRFETNYWLFHPLLAKAATDAQLTIDSTELLSCLQFIDLVYINFPEHFHQLDIGSSTLFLYIASAFLVDDSHFFNEHIRALLQKFLRHLLHSPHGIACSKGDTVPGYGNVVDFFNKFVTQFEDCSYGDPTFCNYLLVFFQQKSSDYFRNFFLSEHPSLIRVVRLRIDELLLPMECLLFPLETNLETLEIYLKTLLCEMLNPESCPVLYCQMVHHLNHALFRDNSPIKEKLLGSVGTTDDKWKVDKLMRSVEKSTNEQLRRHLADYLHFDASCEYGLALIRR